MSLHRIIALPVHQKKMAAALLVFGLAYLAEQYHTTAGRILNHTGIFLLIVALMDLRASLSNEPNAKHPRIPALHTVVEAIRNETSPQPDRLKSARSLIIRHNNDHPCKAGLVPYMLVLSRHACLTEALHTVQDVPTLITKPKSSLRGVIYGGNYLDSYALPAETKLDLVNPNTSKPQDRYLNVESLQSWKNINPVTTRFEEYRSKLPKEYAIWAQVPIQSWSDPKQDTRYQNRTETLQIIIHPTHGEAYHSRVALEQSGYTLLADYKSPDSLTIKMGNSGSLMNHFVPRPNQYVLVACKAGQKNAAKNIIARLKAGLDKPEHVERMLNLLPTTDQINSVKEKIEVLDHR